MTFDEALKHLRRHFAVGLPCWQRTESDITRAFGRLQWLTHENNALRHNSERLTAALANHRAIVTKLQQELDAARSANRNAQTMAAYWRLKAEGGNYDETKEDGP